MLHACVQRFDVTENLEKFCKILGTKHAHRDDFFFLLAHQGRKATTINCGASQYIRDSVLLELVT